MSQFGKNPEYFAAVIGAVVASRLVSDRPGLQGHLRSVIEEINGSLEARGGEPSLASPLRLTRGDEVQGLFFDPAPVPEVIARLADSIYPEKMRFGLGWGTLSTGLGREVTLLDGACFHRAREGLSGPRRTQVWVRVSGFGEPIDTVATAIFHLLGEIRGRWKPKQARYAAAARSMTQKEIATEWGVAPSVVSESLKAAGVEALQAGERAARLLFGEKDDLAQESAKQPNRIA